MRFALLFSGQGTQHARMLRWVPRDHPLVRLTNEELGVADWRDAFQDAMWAARNENAQVFLTGIGLAAWAVLAASLPRPVVVAGYSVGELAAFASSGVFGPTQALSLARRRAAAMDRCAAHSPGGLLAVSGIPASKIEAQCSVGWLEIAIRNSPSAVVLGGSEAALLEATARLSAAGARCKRLNVAVASHTWCMKAATAEFAGVLSSQVLCAPSVPLFSNTADRVFSGTAAAGALSEQISSVLRWDECLEGVHSRRVDCVLEIGPGSALASMWNERFPEIPARSADEFETASAIVDWVAKHGDAPIG